MIISDIPYTIEARLSVPGLDVEAQIYRQTERYEGVFEGDAHTLSMALTPEVRYSRCCLLDVTGQAGPWAPVGDIMFVPRGTRLRVVTPGGAEPYRGLYCFFSPDLFGQTTGLPDSWSAEQLTAALNVRAPQIKRDLYRILKEVSETGFGREALVAGTAQIVLVELARYLRQADAPMAPTRQTLAGWQMRRITDYVEGMVDHSPAVDELARLCDIAPRHLSRAFKISTGRTIGDYVTEMRLIKAKSLLCNTDLPLKEIAHRIGFSGPSSFCVAFGKAAGLTPKQFRAGHKLR
jgi:AraC family transcriptional regulator